MRGNKGLRLDLDLEQPVYLWDLSFFICELGLMPPTAGAVGRNKKVKARGPCGEAGADDSQQTVTSSTDGARQFPG